MFKTVRKNEYLGININIKESVLPIKKINCLLSMVNILRFVKSSETLKEFSPGSLIDSGKHLACISMT